MAESPSTSLSSSVAAAGPAADSCGFLVGFVFYPGLRGRRAGDLATFIRFLAPNLVTAGSIVCAVLAMQAALRGDWSTPASGSFIRRSPTSSMAWWLARSRPARRLVQMDSLADLLNYGFMPAALIYAWFVGHPTLGWSSGPALIALRAICVFYAVAAAFRLARFNVSKGNPTSSSARPPRSVAA